MAIPGFTGTVECPDPDYFCQNQGVLYCKKGCTGNGDCVNNVCNCQNGWSGLDCASNLTAKPTTIIIGAGGSNTGSGSSSDSGFDAATLGIILGCAVGGILIIVFVYKLFVKKGWCKSKRQHPYQTNNRAPNSNRQSQ